MDIGTQTLGILGLGSFVGYMMWGLLGFGAGLTVVANWTIFSTLGFNAGPLRLAIGADSICNVLISIPFLVLAQSCELGDYGLFAPIAILRNAANSIGAYLFKELNVKLLQLILSPVLFVLVILKYTQEIWSACNENLQRQNDINQSLIETSDEYSQNDYKNLGQKLAASDTSSNSLQSFNTAQDLNKNFKQTSADFAQKNFQEENCFVEPQIVIALNRNSLKQQNVDQVKIANKNFSSKNEEGESDDSNIEKSLQEDIFSDEKNQNRCCLALSSTILQCFRFHFLSFFYLLTCRFKTSKVSSLETLYTHFQIGKNNKSNTILQIQYTQKWLAHLPAICIGSIFSGLEGSMVGIPGPPLMYAFQLLEIPKHIARSNASIANVLDFRVVFYFVYGSLHFEHWHVFVVTAICGFAGLVTGSVLSKYLNTKSYYHFLMLLIFVAAVLLMLRGLGVVDSA